MSSNPSFPSLQSIAPHELARIMQTALVDSTRSSAVIQSFTLLDHRLRDGQRGATQFEVHILDLEAGAESRQVVSALSLGGNRTRRLWQQTERMDFPRVVPGIGLRPFAYVPELDVLFQVFPFDTRLEALHHIVPVVSPDIAAVLDEDCFSASSMRAGSWRGASVRYRPDMRATVALDHVCDDTASPSQAFRYFAKVYRDLEQAQSAYATQMSLSEAIAGAGQSLQVARPLAVPTHYNMLLTTAVAGVSLERTMKRGGNRDPHLRAAARAIAALHRLQVSAPTRPTTMEVHQARESGNKLLDVFPGLETRVNDILTAVSSSLQDVTIGFVHGDLKPDHILIDDKGSRVSIIDFDLTATADPMIDIAHFVAFLGKSSARSRGTKDSQLAPIQVFLDEYFAHATHDGLARLPIYHAIAAIHKAAGLTRQPGPESLDQARAVLDEGLRYISGQTAGSIAPTFKRRMTRTM